MHSPIDTPMICPVIVGRASYLAALQEYMDAALAGRGGTTLVAGEAGIGKSRLVTEMRARAAARGMRVLTGRCFEPDHVLPYAPLVDLLRTHAGQSPEATVRNIAAVTPDIIQFAPDLVRSFPNPPPAPAVAPAQERRRLVHAWAEIAVWAIASGPAGAPA